MSIEGLSLIRNKQSVNLTTTFLWYWVFANIWSIVCWGSNILQEKNEQSCVWGWVKCILKRLWWLIHIARFTCTTCQLRSMLLRISYLSQSLLWDSLEHRCTFPSSDRFPLAGGSRFPSISHRLLQPCPRRWLLIFHSCFEHDEKLSFDDVSSCLATISST